MSKYEWKEQTTGQKILYVLSVMFTYFGTFGIAIYSFVIENLVKEQSAFAKIGIGGITCLAILFVALVFIINRHINRTLEHDAERQQTIIKEMLTTTDADTIENYRKELIDLENYAVKVKCIRAIFKNAILVFVFVLATLIFYLVEKATITMRGIFFGMTLSLITGFVFNIAYQNLTRKIKTK